MARADCATPLPAAPSVRWHFCRLAAAGGELRTSRQLRGAVVAVTGAPPRWRRRALPLAPRAHRHCRLARAAPRILPSSTAAPLAAPHPTYRTACAAPGGRCLPRLGASTPPTYPHYAPTYARHALARAPPRTHHHLLPHAPGTRHYAHTRAGAPPGTHAPTTEHTRCRTTTRTRTRCAARAHLRALWTDAWAGCFQRDAMTYSVFCIPIIIQEGRWEVEGDSVSCIFSFIIGVYHNSLCLDWCV